MTVLHLVFCPSDGLARYLFLGVEYAEVVAGTH